MKNQLKYVGTMSRQQSKIMENPPKQNQTTHVLRKLLCPWPNKGNKSESHYSCYILILIGLNISYLHISTIEISYNAFGILGHGGIWHLQTKPTEPPSISWVEASLRPCHLGEFGMSHLFQGILCWQVCTQRLTLRWRYLCKEPRFLHP